MLYCVDEETNKLMLFITCETLPVPSIAQFKVPITIGLAKFVHLCILI